MDACQHIQMSVAANHGAQRSRARAGGVNSDTRRRDSLISGPPAVTEWPVTIRTVLIEDCKAVRNVMVPTLAELGDVDVVAVAEGASEALAVLQSLGATCCWQWLTSSSNKGLVWTSLRACEGHHPGRVMVVLTHYATTQMRDQCMALGADGVFDNPRSSPR